MKNRLIFLIITAFLIRVAFAFLPPFEADMSAWLNWAARLAQFGPAGFYSDQIWTQYTPGFLYWLWLGGKLGWVNELLIKLPVIIADIVTGLLLWDLIRRKSIKLAGAVFMLYVLNPVMIFVGSVWGQIDGLLTLFLFACFYFLLQKKQLFYSWISWAIALLIKPQAFVFLPALTLISATNFGFKKLLSAALLGLSAIFFTGLAFFPQDPFLGLPKMVLKMGQYYHYTSLNAFNFWGLIHGMWLKDTNYFNLGLGLFAVIMLLIFYFFYQGRRNLADHYLLPALSSFAFFLFPTRIHERYLFPFFAFFLAAAVLKKNRFFFRLYLLISALFLINLYMPFASYNHNFLRSEILLKLSASAAPFISLTFILLFFLILLHQQIPKFKLPKLNRSQIILTLILTLSLITRLIRLEIPSNYVFDEVYHAFTAREMLYGNPQAWEWWNTPPPGVAYEWTHPPLAKHFMVLSMKVLDDSSFSWRLPSVIFGVLNIYLVYLLSKYLFKGKNKSSIPLLAAGLYSLESLSFVQSRTGMNDTYMLFFVLLSLITLLKNKPYLSSIAFGLAISSKWSAIYILPGLFLVRTVFMKQGLSFSKLLSFSVRLTLFTTAIYLLVYIPFFTSGHSWPQFIELQRQMYWYHTNLDATHNYSSLWWSWPLMLRPVWYYVDYAKNSISNIYALGNPIIFWGGLIAIISTIYQILSPLGWPNGLPRGRKQALVILLTGYLAFLLPWAFAPRIMFLYHYLPSIPFMIIILAWILTKLPKNLVYLFFVFCFLFFAVFYPHLTALPISPDWAKHYFLFPGWK